MMTKNKTGVLMINVGTPDSPSVADVRKYLREFLMDDRVIDIPFWRRFLLVHGIIVPLRAAKSAQDYRRLWQPQGSPLKVYGQEVQKLLQQALGENFQVELAMRYQNPSIEQVLSCFKDKGFKSLIVIPLYPQYAVTTTGSAIEAVIKVINGWDVPLKLKFVDRFFDHPLFIKAFAQLGRWQMDQERFDHYVFSYHGLPKRQILKASCGHYCGLKDCCGVYQTKNRDCYRAQCFETTRLLVKALGIKEGDYTVCFQSRLGPTAWIGPYTQETVRQLAQRNVKNVLVFSPSFVADCLETTVESGDTYKKLFQAQGGGRWQMVESLNADPAWIECLKQLVVGKNDVQ